MHNYIANMWACCEIAYHRMIFEFMLLIRPDCESNNCNS